MAAQAQTEEIGDATNLVVVLAGTLCEKAEELLRQGLHTADVIAGYPPCTRGQILSQSPTDAASSRWHLYGS